MDEILDCRPARSSDTDSDVLEFAQDLSGDYRVDVYVKSPRCSRRGWDHHQPSQKRVRHPVKCSSISSGISSQASECCADSSSSRTRSHTRTTSPAFAEGDALDDIPDLLYVTFDTEALIREIERVSEVIQADFLLDQEFDDAFHKRQKAFLKNLQGIQKAAMGVSYQLRKLQRKLRSEEVEQPKPTKSLSTTALSDLVRQYQKESEKLKHQLDDLAEQNQKLVNMGADQEDNYEILKRQNQKLKGELSYITNQFRAIAHKVDKSDDLERQNRILVDRLQKCQMDSNRVPPAADEILQKNHTEAHASAEAAQWRTAELHASCDQLRSENSDLRDVILQLQYQLPRAQDLPVIANTTADRGIGRQSDARPRPGTPRGVQTMESMGSGQVILTHEEAVELQKTAVVLNKRCAELESEVLQLRRTSDLDQVRLETAQKYLQQNASDASQNGERYQERCHNLEVENRELNAALMRREENSTFPANLVDSVAVDAIARGAEILNSRCLSLEQENKALKEAMFQADSKSQQLQQKISELEKIGTTTVSFAKRNVVTICRTDLKETVTRAIQTGPEIAAPATKFKRAPDHDADVQSDARPQSTSRAIQAAFASDDGLHGQHNADIAVNYVAAYNKLQAEHDVLVDKLEPTKRQLAETQSENVAAMDKVRELLRKIDELQMRIEELKKRPKNQSGARTGHQEVCQVSTSRHKSKSADSGNKYDSGKTDQHEDQNDATFGESPAKQTAKTRSMRTKQTNSVKSAKPKTSLVKDGPHANELGREISKPRVGQRLVKKDTAYDKKISGKKLKSTKSKRLEEAAAINPFFSKTEKSVDEDNGLKSTMAIGKSQKPHPVTNTSVKDPVIVSERFKKGEKQRAKSQSHEETVVPRYASVDYDDPDGHFITGTHIKHRASQSSQRPPKSGDGRTRSLSRKSLKKAHSRPSRARMDGMSSSTDRRSTRFSDREAGRGSKFSSGRNNKAFKKSLDQSFTESDNSYPAAEMIKSAGQQDEAVDEDHVQDQNPGIDQNNLGKLSRTHKVREPSITLSEKSEKSDKRSVPPISIHGGNSGRSDIDSPGGLQNRLNELEAVVLEAVKSAPQPKLAELRKSFEMYGRDSGHEAMKQRVESKGQLPVEKRKNQSHRSGNLSESSSIVRSREKFDNKSSAAEPAQMAIMQMEQSMNSLESKLTKKREEMRNSETASLALISKLSAENALLKPQMDENKAPLPSLPPDLAQFSAHVEQMNSDYKDLMDRVRSAEAALDPRSAVSDGLERLTGNQISSASNEAKNQSLRQKLLETEDGTINGSFLMDSVDDGGKAAVRDMRETRTSRPSYSSVGLSGPANGGSERSDSPKKYHVPANASNLESTSAPWTREQRSSTIPTSLKWDGERNSAILNISVHSRSESVPDFSGSIAERLRAVESVVADNGKTSTLTTSSTSTKLSGLSHETSSSLSDNKLRKISRQLSKLEKRIQDQSLSKTTEHNSGAHLSDAANLEASQAVLTDVVEQIISQLERTIPRIRVSDGPGFADSLRHISQTSTRPLPVVTGERYSEGEGIKIQGKDTTITSKNAVATTSYDSRNKDLRKISKKLSKLGRQVQKEISSISKSVSEKVPESSSQRSQLRKICRKLSQLDKRVEQSNTSALRDTVKAENHSISTASTDPELRRISRKLARLSRRFEHDISGVYSMVKEEFKQSQLTSSQTLENLQTDLKKLARRQSKKITGSQGSVKQALNDRASSAPPPTGTKDLGMRRTKSVSSHPVSDLRQSTPFDSDIRSQLWQSEHADLKRQMRSIRSLLKVRAKNQSSDNRVGNDVMKGFQRLSEQLQEVEGAVKRQSNFSAGDASVNEKRPACCGSSYAAEADSLRLCMQELRRCQEQNKNLRSKMRKYSGHRDGSDHDGTISDEDISITPEEQACRLDDCLERLAGAESLNRKLCLTIKKLQSRNRKVPMSVSTETFSDICENNLNATPRRNRDQNENEISAFRKENRLLRRKLTEVRQSLEGERRTNCELCRKNRDLESQVEQLTANLDDNSQLLCEAERKLRVAEEEVRVFQVELNQCRQDLFRKHNPVASYMSACSEPIFCDVGGEDSSRRRRREINNANQRHGQESQEKIDRLRKTIASQKSLICALKRPPATHGDTDSEEIKYQTMNDGQRIRNSNEKCSDSDDAGNKQAGFGCSSKKGKFPEIMGTQKLLDEAVALSSHLRRKNRREFEVYGDEQDHLT